MPPIMIKLPDGRYTTSYKSGKVKLGSVCLRDVFFVDGLQCHLISVSQLTRDSGCIFQISDKLCVVQDRISRILIGAGKQCNGLYFFRGVAVAAAMQGSNLESMEVWHCRLGHPSSKALKLLQFSDFSSSFDSKKCDVCIRAKQTKESFPLSMNKSSSIFEMVHCDLWSPYRTPAICGSRYFLTIVDDYSRAVWIYLLTSKQETPTHLKNFLALVDCQFSTVVKTLRSDNGSEFVCLQDYFLQKGIVHETSCVGTPQQNGRVERKHRHILNVARVLCFQAHLPIEFWGYCALAVGYLINRTQTALLQEKTPFELIYQRPPPMSHIRTFGCLCYVHNQKHGGDKFASRSNPSVFIGYPFAKKGWRVYNIETGVISVSRDVVFCETNYPFQTTNIEEPVSSASLQVNEDDNDFSENSTRIGTTTIPSSKSNVVAESDIETPLAPIQSSRSATTTVTPKTLCVPSMATQKPSYSPSSSIVKQLWQDTDSPSPGITTPSPEKLGRGLRPKNPPTRLVDYVTTLNTLIHEPYPSDTPYPLDNYLSDSQFSAAHQVYILAITSAHEPQHYNEAILDENWRLAIKSEVNSLEDLGTWTIEDLPEGKKALGCKWVFRLKFNSDGTLERHKARLVVLGNHQTEGVDYDETFAPVCKMTTVRAFLQYAVNKNWVIHQMDVHNAFLHGDLDEEVYMKLPPGFRTENKNKVCRLRKSLYGLKQAPRCWFEKLGSALREFGFEQNVSDYSLFTYEKGGDRLHVLVYVDDLIVSGNSLEVVTTFKNYLSECFHMKDLGVLRYFLGIEVARGPDGIYLCQRKYALDIIAETGLLGVKPVTFPLEQNHKLGEVAEDKDVEPLSDPLPYRRLVGRLIYLSTTRPEMSYVIHTLSQFMKTLKLPHWEAALRAVRFLKHNPGQGILLRANTELTLSAWCDSDYATCPSSRKSLTGWFIQLGGSPLSWRTKKHDRVSKSSCEAEYRAMGDTVCEILWLRELLKAFGIDCSAPTPLHCDSLSAIHLAANPVFHERTKHIEKECHFIRDEIKRGTISTTHVNTKSQLADIMTKALGRNEFEVFLPKLGVRDLHTPP
ncbi:Retrovirus-related Pol polyprotein from transposon TNT 1-94 [Cardamine amara subsp. amara]|uniref:Retrovirus-related Pol polyprotein from transposon TNT 1-94 n=1 Tax=Cardamine amara subsp. amara TaxID=228776 RepID=A0ABD0ZDP2_CARAN